MKFPTYPKPSRPRITLKYSNSLSNIEEVVDGLWLKFLELIVYCKFDELARRFKLNWWILVDALRFSLDCWFNFDRCWRRLAAFKCNSAMLMALFTLTSLLHYCEEMLVRKVVVWFSRETKWSDRQTKIRSLVLFRQSSSLVFFEPWLASKFSSNVIIHDLRVFLVKYVRFLLQGEQPLGS